MVWSSAQPHSVEDMVETVFGEYRDRLKAIWARDTFGLTAAEYAAKTQTVKNLDIVWSRLTPPLPPQPEYSSLNTILLDDSVVKAHLQPHNHIVIREYDGENVKAGIKYFREGPSDDTLDYMLIAVIGVLDEVTKQSSICGWTSASGLWAGFEPENMSPKGKRPLVWYEHKPTYQRWVEKGESVLADLGIGLSILGGEGGSPFKVKKKDRI